MQRLSLINATVGSVYYRASFSILVSFGWVWLTEKNSLLPKWKGSIAERGYFITRLANRTCTHSPSWRRTHRLHRAETSSALRRSASHKRQVHSCRAATHSHARVQLVTVHTTPTSIVLPPRATMTSLLHRELYCNCRRRWKPPPRHNSCRHSDWLCNGDAADYARSPNFDGSLVIVTRQAYTQSPAHTISRAECVGRRVGDCGSPAQTSRAVRRRSRPSSGRSCCQLCTVAQKESHLPNYHFIKNCS